MDYICFGVLLVGFIVSSFCLFVNYELYGSSGCHNLA